MWEDSRLWCVGGPAHVFTKYHEKDITHIRSHVYEEKSKLTKGVEGYDANALYLCCSGNIMPCGKDTLNVKKKPYDQKRMAKFSEDVLKGKVFGLTLKYSTSFMTSLVRCHHCLLIKRFLIVIYPRKWKSITKKLAEKQWREQKNYCPPGMRRRSDISLSSHIGWDVVDHAKTSSRRLNWYVYETDLFETSLWRLTVK